MIQILYAVYTRTNAENRGHLFSWAPPIEAIGAKGDSYLHIQMPSLSWRDIIFPLLMPLWKLCCLMPPRMSNLLIYITVGNHRTAVKSLIKRMPNLLSMITTALISKKLEHTADQSHQNITTCDKQNSCRSYASELKLEMMISFDSIWKLHEYFSLWFTVS